MCGECKSCVASTSYEPCSPPHSGEVCSICQLLLSTERGLYRVTEREREIAVMQAAGSASCSVT